MEIWSKKQKEVIQLLEKQKIRDVKDLESYKLSVCHPFSAGIDLGSRELYVALSPDKIFCTILLSLFNWLYRLDSGIWLMGILYGIFFRCLTRFSTCCSIGCSPERPMVSCPPTQPNGCRATGNRKRATQNRVVPLSRTDIILLWCTGYGRFCHIYLHFLESKYRQIVEITTHSELISRPYLKFNIPNSNCPTKFNQRDIGIVQRLIITLIDLVYSALCIQNFQKRGFAMGITVFFLL